jgi:putative ABC transport system substrate-binding protein
VQIDIRWGAGNANDARNYAAELVALAPDVILASGGVVATVLIQTTRTVPIVFTQTVDPVGGGLVASLTRPGGNATGFSAVELGMGAKWLELLKQVAPRVTRAAVAPSLQVEVTPVNVRDKGQIESSVAAFARSGDGGLIVTGSGVALVHRELIIALAARYKLPAIYLGRVFVTAGGLMSYGPDPIDPHRRAAVYVDRILKGEKPADLPVQAPTKYELVINLKTAKALGLNIPPSVLARADEVIE